MGEVDRARLKVALSRHYAAQREDVPAEAVNALAAAMVAEDARMHTSRRAASSMGPAAFTVAQARYIPAWTWASQVVLVVLMGAVASAAGDSAATKLAVGLLSAVSVLVGVPTVHASKRHKVAELEYACQNNAASVLVARLIALGCSSSLAVALMVALAAQHLDASAFDVALWACAPFFCSCAGALFLLRKAAAPSAAALSAVWIAGCTAVLLMLAFAFPQAYGSASLAVWASAAALAFAWLVREVAVTCRAAAAGLDAFSPYMARTNS